MSQKKIPKFLAWFLMKEVIIFTDHFFKNFYHITTFFVSLQCSLYSKKNSENCINIMHLFTTVFERSLPDIPCGNFLDLKTLQLIPWGSWHYAKADLKPNFKFLGTFLMGGPQNRALFDLYFNVLELGDFFDSNAFGSGIYIVL